MEPTQIMRILLRRWWLVLLPVIVAGVFVVPDLLARPSGSTGFNVTIRYTAAQVLEAIPQRDGDYQDVWLASELTVNAFTDWIGGSRFLAAVRDALAAKGATFPIDGLGFGADAEKSVGRIDIGWHDPDELTAITTAVVNVLTGQNGAVFPQLGGVNAQVQLLDTPRVVPAPPPLTSRIGPVLRLFVALAGGVLLAIAFDSLDPVIRRRDQINRQMLRVLGTVPRQS